MNKFAEQRKHLETMFPSDEELVNCYKENLNKKLDIVEKAGADTTFGLFFPNSIRTCWICCSKKWAAGSNLSAAMPDLSHISNSLSDRVADVSMASVTSPSSAS